MLFLTHLLFGILIGLIGKEFVFGVGYLIWILLVVLGSVLPDIDSGRSKIVRLSGFVGIVVSFFSKHRGFFHSLWFVVLMVLVVRGFFGVYYTWGIFLGLVGHLFLDGLSRRGVYWFYPFGRSKGWVKVGSWEEGTIQVLLGVLVILVAVKWGVVG